MKRVEVNEEGACASKQADEKEYAQDGGVQLTK